MASQPPVPPSNWKTGDAPTREDLRRIRLFLEQLNDWLVNNTGVGGLSQSETDALYLKRAANDFSTFTGKTVPAGADLFLLEDSAAGGAKKKATLAQMGFGAIYGTGSVPLWVPPAARGLTPGTLDDEFDSTTIGGTWLFRDSTTGPTNRTPNFGTLTENTALTGATTVPNVALHTQGRRSWMGVQTTTTGPAIYYVYKPFTWAAGQVYWTRVASMALKQGTTPSSTGYPFFCLWANAAGVPDNNNRAFIGYDILNGTYRWTIISGGVSTSSTALITSFPYGFPPYMMIANPAGVLGGSANWYGELFGDDGNRILPAAPGAASFTWTPAFIGWMVSASQSIPGVQMFDFVRESAGHPLLHL